MADLDALRGRMKKKKEIESSFSSSRPYSELLNNSENIEKASHHYHLARCYERGLEGYPVDQDEEYREYQKAAQYGHPKALFELAAAYTFDHIFLRKNLDEAATYARKAIEYGEPDGYWVLSYISQLQDKKTDSSDLLEIGISQGSLCCIEWKALLLYGGSNGYGEDMDPQPETAFNLLKDIEWDEDHPIALEVLGNLYRDKGDYSKAINYYENVLNVTGENIDVMCSLGTLLRTEEKFLDYDRAKGLLKRAAEEGDVNAMNQYGLMLCQGEGMPQDNVSAITWFKKAANEGHSYAMLNLGNIMENDNNFDEAEQWYKRADEAGLLVAREELQRLVESREQAKQEEVDRQQEESSVMTEEPLASPVHRRGDGYFITDRCIACGTCKPVCPIEAIHSGEIYWIDPDLCISCGSCASVCPCDAIED